jgi:hypothetical protein
MWDYESIFYEELFYKLAEVHFKGLSYVLVMSVMSWVRIKEQHTAISNILKEEAMFA